MQKRSQQWLPWAAFVGAVVVFFYAYKISAWGLANVGHGLGTWDWVLVGCVAAVMMFIAICRDPR